MDAIEQENVEALQNWWDRYGKSLMVAITTVSLAYVAYTWWNFHLTQKKHSASQAYAMLLQTADETEDEAFIATAEQIIHLYPEMPYADLTGLLLANRHMQNKDLDSAQTVLLKVAQSSKTPAIADIGRLRLARIYVDQQKCSDAHTYLDSVTTETFEPIAYELKGDCFWQMGAPDKAIEMYQKALGANPVARQIRESFLVMKLGDLGVSAEDININIE